MKTFQIGNEVVRTKGDYVVGRVGIIVELDTVKNRAQVQWSGETKTWVSFNALALTSIPYEIIKRDGKYPKYKTLAASAIIALIVQPEISLRGKHFIAQEDIEKHKILYTFQFGGGIRGGCVKAGDVIQCLDEYTNINTPVCGMDKLLHAITRDSLLNKSLFIQLD